MMSGSDFIRIISSLRVYFRRKKPQHSSYNLFLNQVNLKQYQITNIQQLFLSGVMYPSLLVIDFKNTWFPLSTVGYYRTKRRNNVGGVYQDLIYLFQLPSIFRQVVKVWQDCLYTFNLLRVSYLFVLISMGVNLKTIDFHRISQNIF